MKGIHAAILAFMGLGFVATSAPASAREVHPRFGNSGDAAVVDECPPGEYLRGVKIRSGSWWDQVAIGCAALLPSGYFGEPKWWELPRGGNGGGPPTAYTCPYNAALVATKIYATKNRNQVAGLQLTCRTLAGEAFPDTVFHAPNKFTHYENNYQACSSGTAGTGLWIEYGKHVNAIGLVCNTFRPPVVASAPPAAPAAPQAPARTGKVFRTTGGKPGSTGGSGTPMETLVCRGGGGMTVTPLEGGGNVFVSFVAASEYSTVHAPGLTPGQCAWANRPFRAAGAEGRRLALSMSKANAPLLLNAARGGTFTVRASSGASFLMVDSVVTVNVVDSSPLSPGPGNPTPAPAPAPIPGGVASGSCVGGTATIVIPEPHLDRLNVRAEPNGAVVGAVPRGGRVSVIGPCGAAGGAGFRAGVRPVINTPGWCQIQAPVAGCVMSQYLQFGGGGGGVPDGAAGVRRQR